jgi:hypothetical protein
VRTFCVTTKSTVDAFHLFLLFCFLLRCALHCVRIDHISENLLSFHSFFPNYNRSWDISLDGLCTEPIDVVTIPDFPIFCCASKGGGENREFVCGGGNGDPSFIGTPLQFFTDFAS